MIRSLVYICFFLVTAGSVFAQDAQQTVDRRLFTLRKFIVAKENVRIVDRLSQDALTPDNIVTTRSGAEYVVVAPNRSPQEIGGSALGTRYLEIVWDGGSNAWIEFEKLGSRTGHIDMDWLYPEHDIRANVKVFDNDTVTLRDIDKKPIGPLNPHLPVVVKKMDTGRRYYWIQLEQPVLIDEEMHSEGMVFYSSLYVPAEAQSTVETDADQTAATRPDPPPASFDIHTDLPDGPEYIRTLHRDIRAILLRYVQLVDRVSRHYLTLYGRSAVTPTFRVLQLKGITGDPSTDATLTVHLTSNASSAIPLKDSEAMLQTEIKDQITTRHPSVETVHFTVD